MLIDTLNTRITISPWETNGYTVLWLQFKESLGGELPHGKFKLLFSTISKELITLDFYNTYIGEIEIKDESEEQQSPLYCCKFPIFITSRHVFNNVAEFSFTVMESNNFIVEHRNASYTNPSVLLSELSQKYNKNYPFIGTETSDLDNKLVIPQIGETDYEVCTRILSSYKKDTVYGYSFNEGLVVKPIENSNPFVVMAGAYKTASVEPFSEIFRKDVEQVVTLIHSSKRYITSYKYGDRIYMCSPEYENLLENRIRNEALIRNKFYGSIFITGTYFPRGYSLGDVVCYTKSLDGIDTLGEVKCVVGSNEIFVGEGGDTVGPHGFKFECTSELLRLEGIDYD